MLDEIYLSLIESQRLSDAGFQEKVSTVVRECAKALNASRVSIWLLEEHPTQLYCYSMYDWDRNRLIENTPTISVDAYPNYFELLKSSRVIDSHDVRSDPRTQDLMESHLVLQDVRSLLDATLRHNGQTKGVLCIEMLDSNREWTPEEKVFAVSLADYISQGLILEQLKQTEANYKAIYDSSSEAIMLFCGDTKTFKDVNPAALRIFGGEAVDIIGKSPIDLSPQYQSDGTLSAEKAFEYVNACMNGHTQNFEWTHCRIDGTEFDADITLNAVNFSGQETLFALIRDISDKKAAERSQQATQKQLIYRAEHDSLTGLQNRAQLHAYVNRLISQVSHLETSSQVALILFDLNRFKEINDTLGHAAGDKVLVQLAELLKKHIDQAGGQFFRLGGDEFVIVFYRPTCVVPFDNLESFVNEGLNVTINVDDVSVEVGASLGIALYPEHGKDSHELLRCADVAMYYAKQHEAASPLYDAQNDLNNKRRLAMIVELGLAIREDQLTLYFQPRINIRTGTVTGCEALLRWRHPEHGLVSPAEFMPLAEMSDLIHPLSAWVFKNTFNQIKYLHAKGLNIPIAMNISARNLADSQLVETIELQLKDSDLPPELLEIEITEGALINHPQRAVKNLKKLDALGVSIAIDDFGTGYSSLSYLTKLPLDTLKIDRSFVGEMLASRSDSVVVSSTIDLAHNLSFKVVAEGVEHRETLTALQDMGCDQAQGYYIAKPMPAEELEKCLYRKSAH